jgi:hypothetical protein
MDVFVSVSIFGVQMTITEGDDVINNHSVNTQNQTKVIIF